VRTPDEARLELIRWTAGVVAGISIAFVLLFTVALISDDEDPLGVLVAAAILGALTALAFMPLRLGGGRFRLATGAVGLVLLAAGAAGVILLVGLFLLPTAFVYLAVALSPPHWSFRRTLLVAIGVPLGLMAIAAAMAGVGALADPD